MSSLIHRRCLHHPAREAVALCPECRRFYCRECVTEHAGRMIEEHRAQATATGAIYKFVLSGEGGCTFVLNLTDNPSVTEGDGEKERISNAASVTSEARQ